MIHAFALNARLLITFMQRLTKDARRKVFLILDNLNVHKSTPVRDWLAAHRDENEVFFPPPYSRELNPDEYLNGDLDVPPRDRAERQATALSYLRRIQRCPGRVRRYFRHRSIRCAAA